MLKTLLYINEDLASSIALRYVDYLNRFIKISLFVTHVEEVDEDEQAGTGWVRRTWEDGIESNGKRLVDRMLKTENIDTPLNGRPKIFVGDREKEINYELRSGNYDLFVEGYLNTADPKSFFDVINAPLYTKGPCPILMVKNLTISKKVALLCADSVDPKILVEQTMAVLGESSFGFDIIFFKFKDSEKLETLDKSEGGSILKETEELLAAAGKTAENISVLLGSPEQVGDYLKEYALVSSPLPKRESMRMQVLANSLATVMLLPVK
jgi:hypothetical protein